jgi:hypothetical protein
MDTALFLTLFLFAVQIAAGVAPMRWPESRWLAGAIFWVSMLGAAGCLVWYSYSNAEWLFAAVDVVGRKTVGLAVFLFGAALCVAGLSLIASPVSHAQVPAPAPPVEGNNQMPKGKLGDINVNIGGNNNTTGDIGHKIIIQQEVAPSVELMDRQTQDSKTDGGLLTIYTLRVTKPVSRLFVQAQGPTVSSMTIMRPIDSSGVTSTTKTDSRKTRAQGIFEESFSMAMGFYEVRITTADKQIPLIAARIDP